MTTVSDRQPFAVSTAQASQPSRPQVVDNPARMRNSYGNWLVIADAIAIVAAVALAQWLRFGALFGVEAPSSFTYLQVSACIGVIWMLALSINHSRSSRIIGAGAEEYRRVWVATITVFGGVAIVSMLLKLDLARGYLMIALPTGAVLLIMFRWIARQMVVRARKKSGRFVTRVLVVGNTSAVRDLTSFLAREESGGYQVVGACVTGHTTRTELEVCGVGTVPVYGNESTVVGAVTATGSQAVAVTATEQLDGRGIRNLSWELEKLNIELLVAPGVFDIAGPRLHMRPLAGLPLIHVEKPRYHGAKRFQKRLFDIGFSSFVLACALPTLITIAVAIKLTSKGPVFYRSERIGLDGQPFEMIKFRTMVDGAESMVQQLAGLNESEGGMLFKIRRDPRITPVGRFLRKYSLDEIPQFINVLKRDMSVVGPRPPLASEVMSYDDHVKRRLLVRPGITGLWQVSGRSDLSWEDSVRLDLFYVENWSMMADLLIALKTVKAVLGHHGAY